VALPIAAQPNAGKSVVAATLAAALGGLGQKVVLVDLDLQTPCQHALLGLTSNPRPLEVW
jgi:Mrp family chromosome partitioning ATPase